MALNASGPISLGGATAGESINLENAQPATATVSLNDAAVRGLAGPAFTTPGTVIIMPTDFYGKSNLFTFTLAAGTDVNLRSAAITAGWPGSGAVQATIAPGTTIQSSSTGGYALTINGAWPAGITLINNGTVVGRGAAGGAGGSRYTTATNGGSGGVGIFANVPVTITNNSVISGGGGGGGGGNRALCQFKGSSTAGGGGGGGGNGFGSAGPGGTGQSAGSGTAGQAGGALSGGGGGPGGASCYRGPGGPGGAGGSNAGSGAAGTATNFSPGPGGSGGAGGNSIQGNSFITFPALGTIYGPRVG